MTETEFNTRWENYELELEYSQYCSDNYPDRVTFEQFAEHMITEEE